MIFKRPKGTNDIFGQNIYKWRFVENIIHEVCKNFGVFEIRTPMFEYKDLFERGVGEATDVVQKEMFSFFDRGERSYALKPEGTASVCRAYIENNLYVETIPNKFYYITPAFRDERNQAGRFKQFHQFGVEMFGSYEPSFDAEVISIIYNIIEKLKIKDVVLKINSLGENDCRKKYNYALKQFIDSKIDFLCNDCQNRALKNPLRVLDCKNEKCKQIMKDAPVILDYLDEDCFKHFEGLKNNLKILGIPFELDAKIVRGLDYYTKTVFEFVCKSKNLGSQTTICGGGRYDNLVKQCGGKETPAVGFALGIERLLTLMEEQNLFDFNQNAPIIYIGAIGQKGQDISQKIAFNFRKNGLYAEYNTLKRSVKAQLKYADKIGAKYVVIIGDDEILSNTISIKNMKTSSQKTIKLSQLYDVIYNESLI